MSDLERVRGWLTSGALLPPDPSVPNTVDLACALASLCGAKGIELTPGAKEIAATIGEAEHLVFALVDGLGLNLIEEQPPDAFLRRHLALELRAVFLSTTAAALTSLATGLWPAQHALPAWWTYLPEAGLTATVLPFEERYSKRPLGELGVVPASVFLPPPLLARYTRPARSFVPAPIAGSAYSRYVSGGTPASGYETLDGAIDQLVARIGGARAPAYSYLYVPNVDTVEHVHGPRSAQTRAALAEVEAALARLAEALRGRGRLVVSADHGQIEAGDGGRHVLPPDDALLELLIAPPSGEPRVPFFHTRPGRAAQFAARFRERFGERFALLSIDDVEELRLLGPTPLSDATRRRVGDYIAITDRAELLFYGPPAYHSELLTTRGYHGGLLPDEMRVPLIVV